MGNMGASQNLINIINIFTKIKLKNYSKRLILIGDGAKKDSIIDYITKNNIEDVVIKDGMPPAELEKYYDKSDLCIVSLNNNKFLGIQFHLRYFKSWAEERMLYFLGLMEKLAKLYQP